MKKNVYVAPFLLRKITNNESKLRRLSRKIYYSCLNNWGKQVYKALTGYKDE